MSKHTPGPWLQSSTVLVCDQEARIIANCTPLREIPELSIPMKNVDANARLIAAAPDLLAALEEHVNALKRDGWTLDTAWGVRAEAAIKKARGE